MQKKYFTIIILTVLFIILILPQSALAGRFPFEGPLVPCGTSTTPQCDLCYFFKLIQNIIDIFLTLIFFIAPLMIVIGGIIMLTSGGIPEKASQGKRIITYTIIGLVIAFGAWTIINTLMIKLVNPEKMPWAWNEIKCERGGGEIPPTPPGEGGEHCVCEVPVYDLDPNQYPNQASKIGTNIKVNSPLASSEACQQACVSENATTYCPSTLKPEQAKLYCTDESSVKSKRACGIKFTTQETSIDCQISDECFDSDLNCIAVVTPTLPAFNKNYAQKCFVNGEDLCNNQILKGGNSYCPNKYPSPCTSEDRKFALYRWRSEISEFEMNAYDCSRNAYSNTGIVCRLDCQYDKFCRKLETNLCNKLNPPLGQTTSCFGGNYTCQQGVVDQYNDACKELKSLLTCMAGKNMPEGAKEISSISDNSPNLLGGALPGCFSEWSSACGSGHDSCEGTCCGHSRNSLHYGGNLDKKDKIGCRECSWAVDFANENYYEGIKNTAEVCAEKLGYGKVDVIYEGNHVHVELDNVARNWYGCM